MLLLSCMTSPPTSDCLRWSLTLFRWSYVFFLTEWSYVRDLSNQTFLLLIHCDDGTNWLLDIQKSPVALCIFSSLSG
uniref:Uncharacterized protein n=1 Tax=Oryza sativa subsp. japonica TaxID=39947 RepID=Q6YZD6_ORYSJ|nr:unknown protein [Oryza sativa Japonica Group]